MKKKDIIFIFILILISILYFSSIIKLGINFYDEGIRLHYTEKTMSGELIFTDFLGLYTFFYHFLSIIFFFFGKSILVFRITCMIFKILTIILTYICSKKFINSYYSFIISFLFLIGSGPWHKAPFCFLMILNFYLCLYILNYKNILAIPCILLLNLFFRPDVAIFLNIFLLLNIFIIKEKKFKNTLIIIFIHCLFTTYFWLTSFLYFGFFYQHMIFFLLFIISPFILIHPLKKNFFNYYYISRNFFILISIILILVYFIYTPGIQSNIRFTVLNYSRSVHQTSFSIILKWFGHFLSSDINSSSISLFSPSYLKENSGYLYFIAFSLFLLFLVDLKKLNLNYNNFVLFSFTGLLLLKYVQRLDFPHFMQSSIPIYICLTLLFIKILKYTEYKTILNIIFLLLIIFYINFLINKKGFYNCSIGIIKKYKKIKILKDQNIFINKNKFIQLNKTITKIKELSKNNVSFFAFPDSPLIYFLTSKRSLFFDNFTFPIEKNLFFQKFIINNIFKLYNIKYFVQIKEKRFLNTTFKNNYPFIFHYITNPKRKIFENKISTIYKL